MKKIYFILLAFCSLLACNTSQKFVYKDVPNTPMSGFNEVASDAKAIQIADEVMKACGGRGQWDNVHFIRWTFFGRRALVWDKFKNRVRIDYIGKDQTILLDLNTMQGKVRKDKEVMTNTDSLQKYLQKGKEIWINDAYWLVMPFKLKDSGVTLRYVGRKKNLIDAECDVLQLTFEKVGVTPENKYWVYVNPISKLVTQWAYFDKATDEKPEFENMWSDYRPLGHILLSGDRGDGKTMFPMGIYQALPDSVFTSFNEVNWSKMK